MKNYDVIIIGAGFAGLSAADKIGGTDLKALLIDKKSNLEKNIHTTGIIVNEALNEWDISKEHLKPVSKVNLISPSFDQVKIESVSYNFYLTATGKVLQEKLHKIEQNKNIEIRLGTKISKIKKVSSGFEIENLNIKTKYLILADGAKTQLAKSLGFFIKNKYLAGHEYEYSLKDLDLANEMSIFVHPKICKGYIGWVVPGVESIQVGLAVNNGEKLSIENFLEHIKTIYPFKNLKPIGQRSGLIPIGGTCKTVYLDGALVIGDAAGYVSPLTAGGIHTAMRYGSKGGLLIKSLSNPGLTKKEKKKLIYQYQNQLPKFYKKHLFKKVFDTFNTDIVWSFLFKTKIIGFLGKIIFYLRKKLK